MFPTRTPNTLGAALQAEERSMSWLSRKVGVSPVTVMRWVDGIHEPSDENKAAVAAVLGREISVLWPTEADAQPLRVAA